MKSVTALLTAGLVAGAGVLSASAAGAATHPAATSAGSAGRLLATLNDPLHAEADGFGNSVAVSGTTAVVGSWATPDGSQTAVGTVDVYTKSKNRWPATPTAVLQDPLGEAGDVFGNSVAISNGTIVVGSEGVTANGNNTGAAYIYTKGTSGWPTSPTVTLNDPGNGLVDSFGSSVAISGSTVVVGALGASNSLGAAYIYTKKAAGWPATPAVTLDNPLSARGNYDFGYSVSVSGHTVVVGAPGNSGSGNAYIYTKGTTGWPTGPATTLADPAAANGDSFGYSVAVSGSTVAVGNWNGNIAGNAYLYTDGDSGWPTSPTVTLDDPASTTGDYFGLSVAVANGVLVVGAPGTRPTGKAYVYVMGTDGWPDTPARALNHPTGKDSFGYSVAVLGATAVVGEPNGAKGPGAAFVYGV